MLQVDRVLLAEAATAFETSVQPSTLGRTFAQDFASRKLEREMEILDMPARGLVEAWEGCVKAAIPAKAAVEEEIGTAKRGHVSGSRVSTETGQLIFCQ